MKNRIALLVYASILVIIISGCQRINSSTPNDSTENSLNTTENSADASASEYASEGITEVNQDIIGELTLYDWNTNYSIFSQGLISEFNKIYPNIQITVIGPEAADTDYVTTTITALMSGTAGDIIDVSMIPYSQYVKSGLLEDLYSYMDNDPSFQRADYYTNIFDALEAEGKLYGVPMSFRYWCFRFNKTLLEESDIEISGLDSVDYKDITDIYHLVSANNQDLIISKYWDHQMLDVNELGGYLDEKNNMATYNSPEFIEYLNETKIIPWPEINYYSVEMANIGIDCLSTIDENELISFFSSDYIRPENALVYISPVANMTAPIPAAASTGEKEFRVMSPMLAITSSSVNKELAWLFISYCIKEKSLEELNGFYINDGYPINRNNTMKLLESAFGPGHDEDIAEIVKWNQERDSIMLSVNRSVSSELQKIFKEFYDGTITAEDCAAKAQDCVEVYLEEQ